MSQTASLCASCAGGKTTNCANSISTVRQKLIRLTLKKCHVFLDSEYQGKWGGVGGVRMAGGPCKALTELPSDATAIL